MENSPLAMLPPELRDHIYDIVLQFPDNIVHLEARRFGNLTVSSPQTGTKEARLGVLLACRLMGSEGAKRLYATNTFSVTQHASDSPCEDTMEKFLSSIGDSNAAAIKEIRFMYTMSQGTFGNGQFRRSIRRAHQVAQRISGAACKVFLTFLDVYKSIAIKVRMDLKDGLAQAGDAWIEEFEPITSSETVDSVEVRDSMEFLRSQLRECRKDLESI